MRRYNWHSAGSPGCPSPALKCEYIFQINYTEAILPDSTRKLLSFEITKMLIAVEEINLLCCSIAEWLARPTVVHVNQVPLHVY